MRYIRSVLLCLVMLSILQGCYIEPAWYGPPPPPRHHYYYW
jgi:hypothetical protein